MIVENVFSAVNALLSLTKKSFFAWCILTDIRIRLIMWMATSIYRVEWLSKRDDVVQKKTCEYIQRQSKAQMATLVCVYVGLGSTYNDLFLDFERHGTRSD